MANNEQTQPDQLTPEQLRQISGNLQSPAPRGATGGWTPAEQQPAAPAPLEGQGYLNAARALVAGAPPFLQPIAQGGLYGLEAIARADQAAAQQGGADADVDEQVAAMTGNAPDLPAGAGQHADAQQQQPGYPPAGGYTGFPSGFTKRSTTTQTNVGPLATKAGKKEARRYEKDMAEGDKAIYDAEVAKVDAERKRVADVRNQMVKVGAMRSGAIERLGEDRQQYLTQLDDMNKELDAANESLANHEIDPKRFIDNMDGIQKVFLTLASAFNGFGGKPDAVMNMLQKYIDRDIASQLNKQKKLKDVVDRKSQAVNQFKQDYRDARDFKLRMEDWNYSQALDAVKFVSTLPSFAGREAELAGIAGKLLQAQAQRRLELAEKTIPGRTTSTTTIIDPIAAAKLVPKRAELQDKKALDFFTAELRGAQALGELNRGYRASGSNMLSRAGKGIVGKVKPLANAASTYDTNRKAKGLILAKAELKERITDQEGEAFINQLPSLGEPNDVATAKFASLAGGRIQSVQNRWNMLSPQDKAILRPVYEQTMRNLLETSREVGLGQMGGGTRQLINQITANRQNAIAPQRQNFKRGLKRQ